MQLSYNRRLQKPLPVTKSNEYDTELKPNEVVLENGR